MNISTEFGKHVLLPEGLDARIKEAASSLFAQKMDFTGWTDLPEKWLKGEAFAEIQKTADEIRKKAKLLIVIGIGGSYLGAKAVIEALGEYKSTYEAPSCAFDGTDIVYAYAGYEVLAYAVDGEEKISGVVLRDDTVETPEGICIGSDREAVAKAYGEVTADAGSVTFTKGNCDLLIIFTDDKVSSIQYIAK